MGARALLDLQIYCPWSAVTLNGQKIKPHKLAVMRCSNNTLFAICRPHGCRVFTADLNIIQAVAQTANVLEVTNKPLKRNRGPLNEPQKKS